MCHSFTKPTSAEIRPASLQYPLSYPKKAHSRRFSSQCGKALGCFMSFRSCPAHNAVQCFTFKLDSFPSFSSVSTKYQTPGILILILPYFNYLLFFPVYRNTQFIITVLTDSQISFMLQHIQKYNKDLLIQVTPGK